ncbi:MAG TPA: hypothetical protein VMM79_08890 [Longimicrobiales bacterium]|nr:hypothetical protein [Longimicrobiales bacterium]
MALLSQQRPGPTDCITHTTLAQLPAPRQGELVEAVQNLQNLTLQVGRVAQAAGRDSAQLEAQQERDLLQLGIQEGLVGRQVVGQDTMLVWRSPQYHDCQDLIEVGRSDSLIYTARAGVLATIEAQVIEDSAFQVRNTVGIRVAFVQRLAGADYANLRLDRDSACIYVAAPDPAEGRDWRAAVIECSGPVVNWPDVPDDRKLRVNRLTYPGHPQFNFVDYPPVARWEWDTEDSVQAYGFKCGSGWCLAGVKRPVVDMTEYGSTPEEIIHGYRDEQFLADSTHAVPSNGWPSGIWAVLVPHPRLRVVTKARMKAAGGFPAGVVHVRGLDPTGNEHATRKYVAKYGFDPSGGTDVVRIFFSDTSGVSIRRGANEVKTRQMVYRNLGVPPFPAVRWAWSLRDEDQWWPCPEGCCETIDGFQ